MHHWLLPLFILPLLVGSIARGGEDGLEIVATTTQAADLVHILAGDIDGISITALMGPGVDPHLYQPTESDIVAMNQAEMVIYSGLHLEGQFDTVFAALSAAAQSPSIRSASRSKMPASSSAVSICRKR